jgi:hypothetical protein
MAKSIGTRAASLFGEENKNQMQIWLRHPFSQDTNVVFLFIVVFKQISQQAAISECRTKKICTHRKLL